MRLTRTPFWVWLVVGPMIGATVSGSYYWRRELRNDQACRNMPLEDNQAEFEARLKWTWTAASGGKELNYQDIVIYPREKGSYLVSVSVRPRQIRWQSKTTAITRETRWFEASNPYEPFLNATSAVDMWHKRMTPTAVAANPKLPEQYKQAMKRDPSFKGTIITYLQQRQKEWDKKLPPLQFKVAMGLRPLLGLGALGGLVVIGILWPLAIQGMMKLGLVPVPPPDTDKEYLDRFKGSKTKAPDKPKGAGGPSQKDIDEVEAMGAKLEAELMASAGTRTAAADTAAASGPAPVKKLLTQPVEPPAAPPATPEEKKEFGATEQDFYPTEVHRKRPQD